MRKRPLLYLTCLFFVGLLAAGYTLAVHKPLWNDEIFSQVNVEQFTYDQMLGGQLPEGSNPPLYYLAQKVFYQTIHYSIPPGWHVAKKYWKIEYPPARTVIRILPVIYMSLAITAIFYYFARYYSIGTALFALLLTFASEMIWRYWAEARPYPLWVLLTTLQSLIFLRIVREKKSGSSLWFWLGVVNVLLSFTSVFSIAQTVIVALLLWLWVERKDWKRYVLIAVIPSAICFFYFSKSPISHFWFGLTPDQLIRECMPRERFYILYLYLFGLVLFFLQKYARFPRIYKDDVILESVPYFLMTAGMLTAVALIMIIFKIKDTHGTQGFPVSSRYFINLTPIGIIAATLLTNNLLRSFRDKPWLQLLMVSGIGYLVILRFLKVIDMRQAYFPELFS